MEVQVLLIEVYGTVNGEFVNGQRVSDVRMVRQKLIIHRSFEDEARQGGERRKVVDKVEPYVASLVLAPYT